MKILFGYGFLKNVLVFGLHYLDLLQVASDVLKTLALKVNQRFVVYVDDVVLVQEVVITDILFEIGQFYF